MLIYPIVPSWWGEKLMHLKKRYYAPTYVAGFDTETCKGNIMTLQVVLHDGTEKIWWVNDDNVLDTFLDFFNKLEGYVIVYGFNLKFDLSLLLRKWIYNFLMDDFSVKYRGWQIQVFCSNNWFCHLKNDNVFIRILDIHNYFFGSLEKVSNSFDLEIKKCKRPTELGYKKYTKSDKRFIEYALMDARLCCEMGQVILSMHKEFDIPVSTSSANMAEKVFRRNFLHEGDRIKFTPFSATRLAEMAYHGGKNAYYHDGPSYYRNCYEYDFNSAYSAAMFALPSFLSGRYRRVKTFDENNVGVYKVEGLISPCPYGILYDSRFQYYRFPERQRMHSYATSWEIAEALRSRELKIEKINGWVWIPSHYDSPLKQYVKHFYEMKSKTSKTDVRYLFYKLLLNSLYGKWIQRNPKNSNLISYQFDKRFQFFPPQHVAGGLYHPFIASLITGHTRARLHEQEHLLSAIECSTDSVKSTVYNERYDKEEPFLGRMGLETFKCKECQKEFNKFNGVFIRNRLNLLLCRNGHILKGTLHGFWGKPDLLKFLWQNRMTDYQISRMPLIREGLKQEGKPLFETHIEERTLDVDWTKYREYR